MIDGDGLAEDIIDNCGRYKDEENELTCIESTRSNASHLVQGLNEDARMEWFKADSKLKQRKEELRDEVGRVPKEVSEVDDVTVVDRKH